MNTGSTIARKNRTSLNFQNWLNGICSILANKVYLIPDTNFLMRRYYHNYIKSCLGDGMFYVFHLNLRRMKNQGLSRVQSVTARGAVIRSPIHYLIICVVTIKNITPTVAPKILHTTRGSIKDVIVAPGIDKTTISRRSVDHVLSIRMKYAPDFAGGNASTDLAHTDAYDLSKRSK